MAASPPYTVKQVEPVMASAEILVRRFTLAPGEEIPWHRHTAADDLCVLLSGVLRVELREPDERWILVPGDSQRTPAGRAHRLCNPGASDCAFLLIQGVGRRDFVPLDQC